METLPAKFERKISSALHKHVFAHLPRYFERWSEPVSLVMPLAIKDLANAKHTLDHWRMQLTHPIAEIVVPAQSSPEIAAFCAREKAVYIDETKILPEAVLTFDYKTNGRNRNGWIRQQVLKLMADDYTSTRAILIADADTFPIRPMSFYRDGKPLLFEVDEFNPTYIDCAQRLLGPFPRPKRSYIAHCMLFERDLLAGLKQAITSHCATNWIDAILTNVDRSIQESFSEYETYANYVRTAHPERFRADYWYNKKLTTTADIDTAALPVSARRFNFVSRHIQVQG
jgi:Family of unknown function (DUF6492)